MSFPIKHRDYKFVVDYNKVDGKTTFNYIVNPKYKDQEEEIKKEFNLFVEEFDKYVKETKIDKKLIINDLLLANEIRLSPGFCNDFNSKKKKTWHNILKYRRKSFRYIMIGAHIVLVTSASLLLFNPAVPVLIPITICTIGVGALYYLTRIACHNWDKYSSLRQKNGYKELSSFCSGKCC